jgi:asparagine synthase (glutamine-hydrolysing)
VCGIVGKATSNGQPVDRLLLDRMCAALAHRGPDARGVHVGEGAGVGVQRLRVIDLETGDQPVFNEDGTVAVVLNGEIYNYRELRSELVRSGHRFRTNGDTEVIAHLYEEHGSGCIRRLQGMFGLAIWDATSRRLTLARDRVGKKPLFYAERAGFLTFASELQALLEDPEIPTDLDHDALDRYFAYRYVPEPYSAYRAVRKLPPATTLVYSDGTSVTERYWRLDFGHTRARPAAEVHEEIRETILACVRRRLVADVPLGAFLSGGIDSSAVVAAMAKLTDSPVKTFAIGFEPERFDELAPARVVAERFGTDHREFVVRPDAMAMIPKIVRHHGEPYADSSAVPTFHLAELARRHVTVALNGDGGDEAFGGYPRYRRLLALGHLDRVPAPVRSAMAHLAAVVPGNGDLHSRLNQARRFARALPLDPESRYVAYMSSAGGGLDRDRLYTDAYRELLGPSPVDDVILEPWRASSARDPLNLMLDVDTATYLPGDLLAKVDIATMAFGLEARSPLLDAEFLELAASLPGEMKATPRHTKAALRAALRPWLPAEILDRPKQGFEVPVADWLRTSLRQYVQDVLFDPSATQRGYFDGRYVRRLVDSHLSGAEDNAKALWTLLMFELWHHDLVDGRRSRAAAPVTHP